MKPKGLIERFRLTWPAPMQANWNKSKRLHKKRVSQDWFWTSTWPPWRHVKTLHSPLQKREGNWTDLPFTKTSGTWRKVGQKQTGGQTGAYPVTLPLSIAGDVSAPVPLLIPKVANRALQTSSEFYAQKSWWKFFFLKLGWNIKIKPKEGVSFKQNWCTVERERGAGAGWSLEKTRCF